MQIKDIKNQKYTVDFVATIDSKDWKEIQDKELKKLGQNVRVEGFRKGKVPVEILKKHIDPAQALSYSVNSGIDKLLDFIYDQEKFIQIAQTFLDDSPEVAIESVDFDQLTAKFTFALWPTVKLAYKDIKFETKLKEVTDKEINNKIEEYLAKDEMMVPKNGPIANGDVAVINFKGYVDDVAFEGGEAKNYELKIGSKSFIDNFEDQLIGLKDGDKKDVLVTFPKEYHAKNLAGKKAKFEVEVVVVNKIEKAKLDNKFVESLNIENVKTVDQFKKHVKETLTETFNNEYKKSKENEMISSILKNSKIEPEIPVRIVDNIYKTRLNYFLNQFQAKSVEEFAKIISSFGMKYEDFEKNQKNEILSAIQMSVVFVEIADAEKIGIDDEELKKAIASFSQQLQMTEQEVEKEQLIMKKVKEQVLKEKAYNFLAKLYLEK